MLNCSFMTLTITKSVLVGKILLSMTFKFLIESEVSVDGIWALDPMLMTFSWWSKPFGPSITFSSVYPFFQYSSQKLLQIHRESNFKQPWRFWYSCLSYSNWNCITSHKQGYDRGNHSVIILFLRCPSCCYTRQRHLDGAAAAIYALL